MCQFLDAQRDVFGISILNRARAAGYCREAPRGFFGWLIVAYDYVMTSQNSPIMATKPSVKINVLT